MRTWQQAITAFTQYVGGVLGNVEHLATDDKTTLVAAINELAAGGGTGGGGGSPNLLADGTFADGVDGWTAVGTGVTVERTAVDPLDGTHALLVTCDGSHDPGAVTVERDLTGLTVGQMYEVAISVETRTGTPSLSLDVGGSGLVSANSITPEEGSYRRMVVRWYPSASDETIHVTEGTGAACAFAIDVAMVHVATDLADQLDETVAFLTNAPEFVGPLTVVPAEGSPDEGLHRFTVRDEDTWDEFAADSDVTATADGGTRARGTLAEPAAVELGDILRYLWWWEGHDGSGYSVASVAYLQVDDVVSEGVVPTAFVVEQADADGDLQEVLRIASDGTVTANGLASGGATAFDDLTDVSVASASDGDYLRRESGVWVPTSDPTAPYLSGVFSAATVVTQDDVLDPAYEYELVIHLLGVGTGTPQLNFRGRASGADVTSANYYLAGWAKSWAGGFVGWGVSSETFLPLHYQGAANLVTHIKLMQDTSTRWLGSLDSVSDSTGIACQGGFKIAAAIDGFTFYPASSTITGDWALYRRSRT